MPTAGRPWEQDEGWNWEYGDIRLRIARYLCFGTSNLQAIVLRGQLQLEFAITRLLEAKLRANQGGIGRMSFARKTELAAQNGLVDDKFKALLLEVNRLRNAYVHDLGAQCTFRQIHALWGAARLAGIKHRFYSEADEAEADERVDAIGELANELFDTESELVDLLAELFCHLVFRNYELFDIGALMNMPR